MTGELRGLIFDIDGVLVRGDAPIPGAVAALRELETRGYRLAFLSNDSMSSSHACAARLTRHGFSVSDGRALTAAVVAARFARTHLADKRVLVVGMPAMLEAFGASGVEIVPLERAHEAEAFVMGRDESFSYARLV